VKEVGMIAVNTQPEMVTSHPEWFGIHRPQSYGALERYEIKAKDGTTLTLHHVPSDGSLGPLIMTPGTAMSALSFCIDTVEQNLVEFFHEKGFDVWLLDWRTSPELEAHNTPYTLDDVAKYDWPAGVDEVRARTGADKVGLFAHCLSSTAMHISFARGYLPAEKVSHAVASQVALHLVYNWVGRLKRWTYVDKVIDSRSLLHFRPEKISNQLGDKLVTLLARIIPKSYQGGNTAIHRHSAAFGDLLNMERIDKPTADLMGSLIPEVVFGFLADTQNLARTKNSFVLTKDELGNLDRLKLPITYVVGELNNMFVPKATRLTYDMLCEANGKAYYQREVIEGYGHLDCITGSNAHQDVFPRFAEALSPADP
jgi:pimeloyl-ACP methyl ester carboxylesterase